MLSIPTLTSPGPSGRKMESGNDSIDCNWKLAKQGMSLLINNNEEEALLLFRNHLECLEMFAGYATTLFMKGVSTFEDDKIRDATIALHDLENRCNRNKKRGWFQSFLIKDTKELSDAQRLEMDICMGDAQMYLAILTFIGHDFKSYVRGGWLMRKAWKTYQRTYDEIRAMYQPGLPLKESTVLSDKATKRSQNKFLMEQTTPEPIIPKSPSQTTSTITNKISTKSNNMINSNEVRIGPFQGENCGNIPQPKVADLDIECVSSQVDYNILEEKQVNGKEAEITISLSAKSSRKNLTSLFFEQDGIKKQIDNESVQRLFKAVSFGYGLLQLGMSLMPPAIFKLTSIFGFRGSRAVGLDNLEFAKDGTDMRAPLATLALLWYHTVARPFYALDGQNVQAGLIDAEQLLDENADEYANSAFFLYFRGRTSRLQSNILEAIGNLKDCINKSQQREMKLIAMHEIGWCYVIQLNYEMAKETFFEMQRKSRWAKAFYTYLSYLCTCIIKPSDSIKEYDSVVIFSKTHHRNTPLDEYLTRRYKMIVTQKNEHPDSYWKLLLFEILYLWNAFPHVSRENIMAIITVCEEVDDKPEPILGLSYLLMGSAYCILKDTNNATVLFRRCLALRENISNTAEDCHITAFTLYELGQLLLKNPNTKEEGMELLQQTQNYKNYDFDQRLSFRINTILKHKN